MGGFDFTLPGVAVCEAQAAVYEPFFTIDISDLATDSGLANTSRGEAMDVNDDGFAVGWYEDATDSNNEKPFFMTPVDGGFASPLGLSDGTNTFSVGHAIAMGETTSYNLAGEIIAGWVDSASGHQAVYWTWSGSQWNIHVIFNPAQVSESQAVSKTGLVSGYFLNGQLDKRIFAFDPSNSTIDQPASTTEAGAYGVRDPNGGTEQYAISGIFVTTSPPTSHEHAFYFLRDTSGDTSSDLHNKLPAGTYDDSRALAMNSTDDVVGFGSADPGPFQLGFSDAVYWYPTGSSWNAVILQVPNPDPIDSAVAAVTERSTLNGDELIDIVGDYSSSSEKGIFYVVYDRTIGVYASYKLDATTGTNQHPSLAMLPLASRTTGKTFSANGINKRSAIAGSYKPDKNVFGDVGFRPCLYVPNDFDNDKVPDIRQILWSKMRINPDFDMNDNWLLDSVEQMRVGLFGPEVSPADTINDVYAVRFMGYHQGKLSDIVNGSNPPTGECAIKAGLFDHWGFTQNSEIILNVRSRDPNSTPNFNKNYQYDILLDSSWNGGITRGDNLNDIRTFAYRFARCIDGMQFGNEMFTGPGRYYFHDGDLTNYSGDIKGISLADDLVEATTAIFAQIGDQVEAARVGSALAGRPLRMFSPAVAAGMTKSGYCGTVMTSGAFQNGDNYAATAISALANFANDNRLIFDQHTNYTSLADLQETVDKITNNFAGGVGKCQNLTTAPWGSGPDFVATLENGPVPDPDWWTQTGQNEALAFFPLNGGCIPASNGWVDFVNAWKQDPAFFNNDFQLPQVFQHINNSGFMYLCVNTNQEKVKFNTDDPPKPFLSSTVMGALIASEVSESCINLLTNKFMSIKVDYEGAASGYQIIPFNPHPDQCDSAIVCPGQ